MPVNGIGWDEKKVSIQLFTVQIQHNEYFYVSRSTEKIPESEPQWNLWIFVCYRMVEWMDGMRGEISVFDEFYFDTTSIFGLAWVQTNIHSIYHQIFNLLLSTIQVLEYSYIYKNIIPTRTSTTEEFPQRVDHKLCWQLQPINDTMTNFMSKFSRNRNHHNHSAATSNCLQTFKHARFTHSASLFIN